MEHGFKKASSVEKLLEVAGTRYANWVGKGLRESQAKGVRWIELSNGEMHGV